MTVILNKQFETKFGQPPSGVRYDMGMDQYVHDPDISDTPCTSRTAAIYWARYEGYKARQEEINVNLPEVVQAAKALLHIIDVAFKVDDQYGPVWQTLDDDASMLLIAINRFEGKEEHAELEKELYGEKVTYITMLEELNAAYENHVADLNKTIDLQSEIIATLTKLCPDTPSVKEKYTIKEKLNYLKLIVNNTFINKKEVEEKEVDFSTGSKLNADGTDFDFPSVLHVSPEVRAKLLGEPIGNETPKSFHLIIAASLEQVKEAYSLMGISEYFDYKELVKTCLIEYPSDDTSPEPYSTYYFNRNKFHLEYGHKVTHMYFVVEDFDVVNLEDPSTNIDVFGAQNRITDLMCTIPMASFVLGINENGVVKLIKSRGMINQHALLFNSVLGKIKTTAIVKDFPVKLNQKHPSHVTRSSDASSFDEVCTLCGAKDEAGNGWGKLAEPCTAAPLKAVFLGVGGYDEEERRANQILTVGVEYEIENVEIGSSISYLTLKGFKESFNTVQFDIEFDILMERYGRHY